MRIVTWNINGIRSTNKTSIQSMLDSFHADIICLQETKITRNLLPDHIGNVEGYYAFFSFSRAKGGYSGVVTYCKKDFCPIQAYEGLTGVLTSSIPDASFCEFSHEELKSLDSEGRAVMTTHKTVEGRLITVINVYCPRADPDNIERFKFKMDFYSVMKTKCKCLLKDGNDVILLGDLNVSHKRIDHCDPDDEFESSIARQWFDQFLIEKKEIPDVLGGANMTLQDTQAGVLIDSYRSFHAGTRGAFTCWNTKTRARETNYGTRIDYILCNSELLKYFTDCRVRPDIDGSDHCPVEADIDLQIRPSDTIPQLCSVNMPELAGKQQTIKSYFNIRSKSCKRSLPENGPCSTEKKMRKATTLETFFSQSKQTKKKEGNIETQNFDYFNATTDCRTFENNSENKKMKSTCWKKIFKGPEEAPLCSGHKEPAVLRTVKKAGPNLGKQFYVCQRAKGHSSNKEASCNFFMWRK